MKIERDQYQLLLLLYKFTMLWPLDSPVLLQPKAEWLNNLFAVLGIDAAIFVDGDGFGIDGKQILFGLKVVKKFQKFFVYKSFYDGEIVAIQESMVAFMKLKGDLARHPYLFTNCTAIVSAWLPVAVII
jgi:hypothetical protein